MHYPSTPPKICAIFLAHRHKGSAFLALVLVMAIVSSLFSLGSAKVTQAAMNGTSSNKTSLQAQHFGAFRQEKNRLAVDGFFPTFYL